MMINVVHLFWIVPLSVYIGMLMMAVLLANEAHK